LLNEADKNDHTGILKAHNQSMSLLNSQNENSVSLPDNVRDHLLPSE